MKVIRAFDDHEMLWKYFRLERFIQFIETGKLHFASANQFEDLFEGAVAVQMTSPEPDPRYSEMEALEGAFFELKKFTKISCWHRADYESDAMWKLYAGERKGIAICSTPERMRKAFKPFRLEPEYGVEDLCGGPVEYVDLTQVRMREAGMLGRFFYKHRAFEWEREFRLAISLRQAAEFGVRVPDEGILVDLDIDVLVERVILGSTTTEQERATVRECLERVGQVEKLQVSTLLGHPRYI